MHSASNIEMPPPAILSGPGALGYFAVAVAGGAVAGVDIGHRTSAIAENALTRRLGLPASGVSDQPLAADEDLASEVLTRLQQYAEGEPVDFSDMDVCIDGLSPFQRRVVAACRGIPYGQRRTYGDLARTAGRPRAARAVGQVMASNRVPLIVPCHRVVASGGGLGGYSAPQGLAMKRLLLALEAHPDLAVR